MTPKETRSIQTLASFGLSAERISERLEIPQDEVERELKRNPRTGAAHPWRRADGLAMRGRDRSEDNES